MKALTILFPVDAARVEDALAVALDGGVNYWVAKLTVHRPAADRNCPTRRAPLYDDGAWAIEAIDDERTHFLGRAQLTRGLELMAKRCPDRLARLLDGEADAEDADVFVQLCLFGTTVYG